MKLKENEKKVKFLAFICTPWTVNDVTVKNPLKRPGGIFPDTVGVFYLERSLKKL